VLQILYFKKKGPRPAMGAAAFSALFLALYSDLSGPGGRTLARSRKSLMRRTSARSAATRRICLRM